MVLGKLSIEMNLQLESDLQVPFSYPSLSESERVLHSTTSSEPGHVGKTKGYPVGIVKPAEERMWYCCPAESKTIVKEMKKRR